MKRTLTLAAAALLSATFFAGAASAKTFVYCSEGSPEGFDPGLYTAGTTFDASGHPIYSRLLEFKPGTTQPEAGLAESWDISSDGTVYTFKLRSGVKFQTTDYFTPTRDFNADDVIFSLGRQIDENNAWNKYISGGTWEYAEGMGFPKLIKSIEKVDDLTVKITLNRPEAPFLANIAMPFASILSKEYADSLEKAGTKEQLNQQPVGTGPFTFVAYQQDAIIRYKKNADYWGGAPKIDDLVFAITTDAAVRYQKLKAGECHLMPYPNAADVESMKSDPNLEVLEQEGLNIAYLAYNTTQAPFDKPEVRIALNKAINKKAIVDAVFQGMATPATNPIPPTMWSYNNDVKDDTYDLDAAKKMLEDAGVKDLSMKVWAMPVSRPYMLNARRAAEIMQDDFAKIGVKVEIVSYEWAEYLQRSKDKNRDGAAILGWTGDNGDPDNWLATLFGCKAIGGNNFSRWCYQPFEDLVVKAKRVTDQGERTKLYEQAQQVLKQQVPMTPIAHSTVYMPMRKEVQDYKISPFGLNEFYGVSVSK